MRFRFRRSAERDYRKAEKQEAQAAEQDLIREFSTIMHADSERYDEYAYEEYS